MKQTINFYFLRAIFALSAAAGFAAATVPANAQQATMSVFARTSGMVEFIAIAGGARTNVDASQNLVDFVAAAIPAATGGPSLPGLVIRRVEDSGSLTNADGIISNNLPTFGGAEAEEGNILVFLRRPSDSGLPFTVRIYDADDGAGVELAMATVTAVGASTTISAADYPARFFLNTASMAWEATNIPSADNVGHAAPDCAGANRMAGDLMCGGCLANFVENSAGMCVAVPTCGVDMRLDESANECVACDAGMVSDADEQTCRMPMSDAECMRADAMTPMWDGNMCVAAATPMPDPACENGSYNATTERCDCNDGYSRSADGLMCVADTPTPTPPTPAPTPQPTPPAASQAAEEADWATAGGIVGGLVGFIVALHYLDGEADAFSFNPDFGYSISESGYSYKYGGRLDLIKDAWSLYMSAGQRNSDGEFGDLRYESGGEYDGGFWRAAFSESIAGDITDYDFSLSADWRGGIWKVSPTYRFRSQLTKNGLESESKNALNLEAALRYNRWTLRPSAGFRWRRADDFGGDAKFAITAVRRF